MRILMASEGRMLNNLEALIHAYNELSNKIIHDDDPERKRCYHQLNDAFIETIKAEANNQESP